VFSLTDGHLYLCTPVNGRVIAAFYFGTGHFSMNPPTEIERKQLFRFYGADSVVMGIGNLFLLFADSTLDELTRQLRFSTDEVLSGLDDDIEESLAYLADDDARYFDPDIMRTFLHNDRNSLFFAHINDVKSTPFFFEVNPFEEEGIVFMQRDERVRFSSVRERVSQFPPQQRIGAGDGRSEAERQMFGVTDYRIENTITDGLDFSASAHLTFTSFRDSLQWLDFYLAPVLDVDSATWRSGTPAHWFKGKESPILWVQLDHPMARGEVCSLSIAYHGDLLTQDEFGWINIKSSWSWFPRHGDRTTAKFTLTFHTPTDLTFVSVGKRESYEAGQDAITTVWRSPTPIRNASFNIGRFNETTPDEEALAVARHQPDSLPRITVYMAKGGHRTIAHALASEGVLSGHNMDEDVVADLANSAAFFQKLFGRCPVDELYGTEIPSLHGEAFPGLLHLSWVTYQFADAAGGEELFRSHEVAHQWWGIGVDFKTYHDQWLSEGFAEYSGLLYVQTILKDNDKFFDMLDEWKEKILNNRQYIFGRGQEAGPIWLGYRTQSATTPGDYDLIVYKKGAWVLHMLRNMMIDLQTMNEDRFKKMMRDFYTSYSGKRASTADFQRIVERHMGCDMDWFFQQWVMGTKVPLYHFAYRTQRTPEGKVRVTCRIRQENVPEDFHMYIPLLLKFDGEKTARLRLLVSGARTEYELPLLPLEPEEIVFNDLRSVLCEVDKERWEEAP
jgi:hypothetical protein